MALSTKTVLSCLVLTTALFGGTTLAHGKVGTNDWLNKTPKVVDEREEFTQTRKQAITKLQERGYQVHSIQLQTHRDEPVFFVFVSKHGVRYVVKLTYPNLKIVQERRENWRLSSDK